MKDFRELVIGYGKRLPTAVYLFRPSRTEVSQDLSQTISRAEIAASPDASWNILKLHMDQFAITFLSYPDFDADPHPALAEATKINLNTGSVERTAYRERANPPILHRKETFLPPGDPRIPSFAALTKREEEAGFYRDSSTIGLRIQWATLLRRLGWSYEGHELVATNGSAVSLGAAVDGLTVARHRTAIRRYDLSKPVKQLLERGLLRKVDTFFDFGCGHGMDVEALQNLGYQASGWDPAFRPNVPKTTAEVVNLGYVLNVIEEPAERIGVLREAFSLTGRVLLVSTMVTGQESDSHSQPYRDGFITKTNTFQKFFAPGELESLIEQALNVEAITLAYGLCVVFRNENDAELFQAARTRRRIDWTEIGTQLKFSSPRGRERRTVDLYALHKELFDDFWHCLLDLGRAPEAGEYERTPEIVAAAGGIKRGAALVVERNGAQIWQECRKARSEDVLVYLAMTKFRKRFLRREIPSGTKNDIKSFFGDLGVAQSRAQDLLFAAGDADEIELACGSFKGGWQDEDALIVHRTLFSGLPPVLRIYVLCAGHRYGDPAQADLIKIHKHSGKITFQHFDDFDGKPLPELQTRIKVNLRNLFVEVFDHSKGPKTQLLFFKERFVGKDYPGRLAMERYSAKLRKLGLNEATIGLGPDKDSFYALLTLGGLNKNLNPYRRTENLH
jgi:DNA phosphorothioation-associated putative methyltransferase